ncbi:MAG TPA: substrate-binding domain-containing protein [Candidatus Angelobacter sp.]|nr:substrate-binding domain-containing protein [Candidatus Angelobacter sp.]
MKKYCSLLVAFFVFSLLPCYAHHLAVVVNSSNTVDSVSVEDLSKIFKAENRKWPDGHEVVIIMQGNADERNTLERLYKMTPAQFREFMQAHKSSVITATSDAMALTLVETTKGAITLVDVRSINAKVKVLKVNGKLPLESGYLPH